MQWWMRPGPRRCWAIRKPAPSRAEQRVGRDAHVLVEDLGVAAELAEVLAAGAPSSATSRTIFTPGRVGRHDEHRRALVRARVGVGDRHDDQEVGDRGVGGEPLVAVDDPLVAVAHGARLQQRRVRARRSRARSSRTPTCRSPASSGCSQRSFCSSRARPARGSRELPESGAWLPNAFGANGEVPRISCIRPSLTWPKPWPPSSGVQVRGPQPALLDLLLQRRVIAVERRPGRARRRPSRAARSPRARSRASSRAAPGTRARSRSPTPCCRRPRVAVAVGATS